MHDTWMLYCFRGLGSGKVAVDLGEKLVWLVIVAGILSVVIIGVIKIGEVVVRRRTDALLAAHSGDGDGDREDDQESPKS